MNYKQPSILNPIKSIQKNKIVTSLLKKMPLDLNIIKKY